MNKQILKFNIQRSSDCNWVDEKGTVIPYNRITTLERLFEKKSGKLLNDSIALHKKLKDFKDYVQEVCTELYERFMQENNSDKKAKGNFTFYNFDRSIKVEVSISERIEFDDLTITACREKLQAYVQDNIESKDGFGKQLIDDAFSTSRGKLDAKKVMSLLRYRDKIKAPTFQEALNLLEKSIRRPSSKMYYRVFATDVEGKFQNIDLNFSSL